MRAYFVRVRTIVVGRHLWFYDSGRLRRVEIVTLTVGAPFDSSHLLLSWVSFNMSLSRANWALKENSCTAGYVSSVRKHCVSCLIYYLYFTCFLLLEQASFTWPLNLCISFVKAQRCNGDETAFLVDTCVHKRGLPCEILRPRWNAVHSLFYKKVRFRV